MRSLFCFWAVRELGFSLSELARRLGLSVPGVGLSVKRGERLAAEKRLRLFGKAAGRSGKSRAEIYNV